MAGAGALFLILVVIGTLFLAGNDALQKNKGKEVYKEPEIAKFLTLPPPPSGEVSREILAPGAPKDVLNSAGSGSVTYTERSSQSPTSNVTPPKGYTSEQISPFYHKVRVSSFSPAYSTYSKGNLALYVPYDTKEVIQITGWKIRANSGFSFSVPKGVSDYGPMGVAASENILVKTGDRLEFYTTAPAFIYNVKVNKCMGYLNNRFSVSPAFSSSCPYDFDRRDVVDLSGQCQNFLLSSFYGCRESSSADYGKTSAQCVRYFDERAGYANCYKKHRSDTDFYSNTWRIWMDTPFAFDTEHDRVILLDGDGKVVDEYIY